MTRAGDPPERERRGGRERGGVSSWSRGQVHHGLTCSNIYHSLVNMPVRCYGPLSEPCIIWFKEVAFMSSLAEPLSAG